MQMTHLRKVGGSTMVAVPPALLELLRLHPGSKVGIAVEGGRLILEPHPRPRYTLAELLARCHPRKRRSPEERQWLSGKPAGAEIL